MKAEMIEKVLKIAFEAGKIILDVYQRAEIAVEEKADNSPVTEADLRSSAYIVEQLEQQFPYPVVSEERPIDYQERKGWDKFWLVDPLDGTKNFIHRDGQFTINIALIHGDKPVVGVVYVPLGNIAYFAEEGEGAYKQEHAQTVKIWNDRNTDDLISATSVFHDSPASKQFCDVFGIKHSLKFGSAVKLCKLAEGEIDVYPRFVGTKEWDTAAAHCIAMEANCKVIDIVTKRELVYNKERVKNNCFIASRNNLDFIGDRRLALVRI
ncbi:3'(2'),5'-bisphosphate nucleotidase CysQ [Oligoflexia bacterium]|nr:3'(2'),5'-bisphosphate nucleotidase CysQ [Oligoflexia bacterium]